MSMYIGGYRHDCEGFYEKTTYQMSINKGRITTFKEPIQGSWEFSPFFSFSLGEEV